MTHKTGNGAYLETVDWTEVDHVLLDMDGTLLDLAFDNDFWGIASTKNTRQSMTSASSKPWRSLNLFNVLRVP